MKLNFWQIVGLILLLVGVVAVIYRETRPAVPANGAGTQPVVQPAR